ncbi:MAG TPA: hypothetical protein VGG06_32815 [Thermoanaerobaculia bacterium]
MNGKIVARIVTAGLAALAAAPVWACAVCFGETDSPMARGAELSIMFMVGVTYVVIVGGVAAFLALRFKARRNQTPQEPLSS